MLERIVGHILMEKSFLLVGVVRGVAYYQVFQVLHSPQLWWK